MSNMKFTLCLLVCISIVFADESEERRSKLPYVADAVGNSIPRPSSLPATVGSPVNLLTPDRYEFYTFDDSGELVKRLMTLEEIQAIVAAGDDADGLVTFANENQPTIAFNFSQPPYTKVNSVVTNVQNVLKAQMEAHKNNPQMRPTLDTPDVSDSWSLILPSIFGNTGVDIVPDKTTGSFITPETETIDVDNLNGDYLYSFSKEANGPSTSPSTERSMFSTTKTTTAEIKTTKTSTTTPKSVPRPSTVRLDPRPVTTRSPTTELKITTERIKTNPTTAKPLSTTKRVSSTNIHKHTTKPDQKVSTSSYSTKQNVNLSKSTTKKVTQTTTEKSESVYIPISTVSYLAQKHTNRPTIFTNPTSSVKNVTNIQDSVAKVPQNDTMVQVSSSNKDEDYKINSTTITTQSVSPSTNPSFTQGVASEKGQGSSTVNPIVQMMNEGNSMPEDPILPLFDVAQSISQIASDLGGNYAPLPTSNILENNKQNIDIEGKENVEIDIPQDAEKTTAKNEIQSTSENFVKVFNTSDTNDATIEDRTETNLKIDEIQNESTTETATEAESQTEISTVTTEMFIETTTVDSILSDSMGDLLSQVVYQTNNIVSSPNNFEESNGINSFKHDIKLSQNDEKNSDEEQITTTVAPLETTTVLKEELEVKNEEVDLPEQELTPKVDGMIDSTEKSYKHDDSSLFIPISTSVEKNTNKIESWKLADNKKKIDESNNLDTKIKTTETSNVLNIQSEASTSIEPKIETTTRPLINKNSNSSPINNKVIESGIDKINKAQIEKITSELPKIDEFKKKIQKINIDDKELANERNSSWKLIPTVPPPKLQSEANTKYKPEGFYTPESSSNKHIALDFSKENQGLEVTTKDLGEDISQFIELCNELAFQYWTDMAQKIDNKRSFVLSPYAITSMLAMMFMGARGSTSGEMNDILKLDDMLTFNPHFTLRNISDSIDISPASGVAVSAFIRELYSDKSKGKILTFYKERAQQFYNGHVEEINFKLISDVIRRRTNLLVKRYTMGRITEYMKTNSIVMQPPLAAFSMNIFHSDCTGTSVDGRDGEMYFVVSPNVRQRRLVPVPAVVYKSNFLAGYDPVLDATAAALGNTNSVISTLFLMPGQQGNIVHADDLEALEKRLLASSPTLAWNRLLRTLLPRNGLELQIPRFSHKSIFNISSSLRKMGLKDLFDQDHADLGGLNGPSKNLFLSDMIQLNSFVTCGEGVISEQHHIEEYPEVLDMEKAQRKRSARLLNWDEPRDYQRAFHDPHDVGDAMNLPLHLRPRQARLPARNAQPARLKFDRPFLFFVRHNPSGMILYLGRYNPRLLP